MKPNFKIKYYNNWKNNDFNIIRVINDDEFNIIKNIFWFDDNHFHPGTIGQWKLKKK